MIGKTEELKIFEPLTSKHACSSAAKDFLDAFSKLEAKDASASQAFAAVVGKQGNDPLATRHLKRTLAGESGASITLTENIGIYIASMR